MLNTYYNVPKENIKKVRAKIEIFGPTYERLGEFYTNEISINSKGEGKQITAYFTYQKFEI